MLVVALNLNKINAKKNFDTDIILERTQYKRERKWEGVMQWPAAPQCLSPFAPNDIAFRADLQVHQVLKAISLREF